MYGQPTYGAVNAIADIASAIMQRNQQRGLLQGVLDYQNKIANDNLTNNTQTVQGVPTAADVGQGLGGPGMFNPSQSSGLFPSLNKNTTQAPVAENIGTGLLGKPASTPKYFDYVSGNPQQAQIPGYTYQKDNQGTDLQNADGTFTAVTPDGQQHTVMSDANTGYAIDPAQNPGSYDWYNGQQKSQPQATQPASGVTIKNTTSFMTPQQAKSHINQGIRQAALEMSKKYGFAAMKDIMPMLQAAGNDKLAEHQQTYNTQQISTLMQNFNSSTNPYQRAMYAAQMKQYGLELDPKMISTLQPEYKMEVVDQGPQKSLVLWNPKSGQVASAGALPVGISPNTKYTADVGYQGKIDAANIGANARLTAASMRGSGNGRAGSEKINGMTQLQAQNEISRYKQWRTKNPDADISDYPRQEQYEAAGDPYGDYSQADNIVNQIKAANPNATDAEIFQYLHDNLGYGGD